MLTESTGMHDDHSLGFRLLVELEDHSLHELGLSAQVNVIRPTNTPE